MQGEGAGLRLGEEFHHNRVAVICTQISGVAPALQHRWDTDRLARTAMDLAEQGRLRLIELITHTIPMAQAAEAFRLLDSHPEEAMQVVLSFGMTTTTGRCELPTGRREATLPGETLMEKFEFVRSVEFDGIELSGPGDGIFGSRAAELRAARAAGVVMPTAVVHMDHFIGDFDPERRRDAIDQLKVLLSTIVEAGGTGIVSPHAYGLFSSDCPRSSPLR